MAPADASRKPQANRQRPTPVVPIVPVVPLARPQKRRSLEPSEKPAPPEAKEVAPEKTATGLANGDGTTDLKPVDDNVRSDGGKEQKKEESTSEGREGPQQDHPAEPSARQDEKPATPSSQTTSEAGQGGNSKRNGYRLPPPFYPASHPSTTSSPVSARSQQQPFEHVPLHHPNPSVNNITFGGYPESSNPSPAPSASAEGMPYPQQLPPFAPAAYVPGPGPQVNHNHSHHASEPIVPFGYPQQFYPPNMRPDIYYQQRFAYPGMPPPYYDRAPSFVPPEHNMAYPAAGPALGGAETRYHHGTNGPSISSQASSHRSASYDRTAPSDNRAPPANNMGPNVEDSVSQPTGAPWHASGGVGPAKVEDDADGLVSYVQSQFGDREFADVTLEVTHISQRFPPMSLPVHSVIAARSPLIKRHMNSLSGKDGLDGAIFSIGTADQFLEPDAVELAIKRLYGSPLLTFSDPRQSRADYPGNGHTSTTFLAHEIRDTLSQMNLALAYTAAGRLLEIESVSSRGSSLAVQLLDWDTLERALNFALSGGLGKAWESLATSTRSTSAAASRRGSSVPPTPNTDSTDSGNGHSRGTDENASRSHSGPTYGEHVGEIIDAILRFLTSNLPKHFRLDTSVSQLDGVPRLPSPAEMPKKADPRLKSIRFGDYSPEEADERYPTITLLSKILLSLPFALLKFILEYPHLGNPREGPLDLASKHALAQSVIQEREKRRQAVRCKPTSSGEENAATAALWDAVGWEEQVIPHGPHGDFELIRTKLMS